MSDLWDLFLLFICAVSNGIYFAYGFIISYHISYIKHFYPYTIAQIYATVVALDIGLVISGFCYFRLIKAIGINNGFRLYAVLCSLVMVIFVYFPHIFWTSVGYFFIGFSHQLNNMNINYCLNLKFKANLVKYTGYVFTGTSVSCIMWGILSFFVVNPGNEPKTQTQVLSGGEVEQFFDFGVAGNMKTFFLIYALVNFVCPMFTSVFFKVEQPGEGTEDPLVQKEEKPDNAEMLKHSVYATRMIGGIESSFYQMISGNPAGSK